MNELETLRKRIDDIDRDMARLFESRMEAVAKVAEYKAKNGLAVYDPQREAGVVQKNAALLQDDSLYSYYVRFLRSLMDISKDYQRDLTEDR